MARGDKHHGIENEPALRGIVPPAEPDPSEAKAQRILSKHAHKDAANAHEHSVFDELAILPSDHDSRPIIDRDFSCNKCGYNLRGTVLGSPCPECNWTQYDRPSPTDRPGFAQWLTRMSAATSQTRSWLITLLVALVGGAWGVIGAFWGGSGTNPLFSVAVWGPAVEEATKIAIIAVIIERWPYLFKSRLQIMIAALGAGLMFAVIENFIYLYIYVPNPPQWLVAWRWTVCVALHVGCTVVAGVGAVIVWQKTMTQLRRYPVPIDLRWLVAAIVIHGGYNGAMTLFDLAGRTF